MFLQKPCLNRCKVKMVVFVLKVDIVHKHIGGCLIQIGIKCASHRARLIDSEDPKHTLFCRKTAFVVIYAFFQG